MKIENVQSDMAEQICRDITQSLPGWFGQPEANERYAKGVAERIALVAFDGTKPIGLISLEFHYPNNANIYWFGVMRNYHDQGVGAALMKAAVQFCIEKNCDSMTVETLAECNGDEAYLKTYRFYERCGFRPLFDMNTYGHDFSMVYMIKMLEIVSQRI